MIYSEYLQKLWYLINSIVHIFPLPTSKIDHLHPTSNTEELLDHNPNLHPNIDKNITEMMVKKIITLTAERNLKVF